MTDFRHDKQDPLVCPGHDAHNFNGWRTFEDPDTGVSGGESVCLNCGVGAIEHSLARADKE